MGDQTPSQNATGAPTNAAVPPRVLVEDPIFKSIHDAFQMGWNIIELKSRIQLASVSSSILGTPTTVPMSTSPTSEKADELIQKVAHAQSNLLQPQAKIIQSHSNDAQPESVQDTRFNLTDLPDSAWSTSLWRSTFTCIADNHKNCFPGSNSENTYYALPQPPDPANPPNYQAIVTNVQATNESNIHLPYYYLYPGDQNTEDYATVGIPKDDQFPDAFTIYDVTRRAVNCLTLLYTNPDDSLIPLTLHYYQQQLLQNISTYKELAATLMSNTAALAQTQASDVASNAPVAPQDTGATPVQAENITQPVVSPEPTPAQQKVNAIQLVSNLTMRYLENWDSFARETFYVSGSGSVPSNEMQLVAYEAGRAMSSLSWGITSTTVHLENVSSQSDELNTLLEEAWLHVFDDTSISSIQHQVSALSSAMDGAYYRVHTDVPHPTGNDAQGTQNLDLPGQGIQAITNSLDYWNRAVKKICSKNDQKPITKTTPAQGTQNTTQSTVQKASTTTTTGPSSLAAAQTPSIPRMSPQTSTHLRQTLIKQAQVWQPLLLHQQSLQDFTLSYVTERIWSDFMQEFEQATSQGLFSTVEKSARRYLIPIIGGIAALILILGFLVFLLVRFPSLQQSLVTTFVLVIGSVVGFFGTMAGRARSLFTTESSNVTTAAGTLGPISAIAGIAETGLIDAFQRAYQQIQTEFDYLDHNVSVTYPLVEFFITNAIQSIAAGAATDVSKSINDAYDFLTQVVWTDQDRADEIARITRAALGPIGALVGASTG
jgi:hypothetical protein